jgi:hypothetical protein
LAGVRGYGATVRARLSGRRKAPEHLGSQAPPGIDQRLAAIEAAVLAGQHVERPWEIIRMQLGFVGHRSDVQDAAALAIGEWARRHGIQVKLFVRKVEVASVEREVIMARFTARRTTV